MAGLITCQRCNGFMPEDAAGCPHCDAPASRSPLRRALVGAGLGSLIAVTLMACYGTATGEIDCDVPDGGDASVVDPLCENNGIDDDAGPFDSGNGPKG